VLPAYLVSATLVFENVSRSTLLWYVFSMIPLLALGIAHLVTSGLDLVARTRHDDTGPIAGGLGIAALVLTVDGSLARVMSRLDVLVGAALVAAALVVVDRARGRSERRAVPASLVVTALTVVIVLGALRHPSHRSGPAVEESLMARAGRFGEVPVSVDERMLARAPAKDLHLGTYFGAHARQGPAPWLSTPDDKHPRPRVRVDLVSWPEELSPRPGVTLLRGPGGVVLEGALDVPPYSEGDVEALLAGGALTFEAEHGVTTLPESLMRRSGASGGAERARRPRDDEKPPGGALTSGPWFRLPAGDYEAVFDVSYRCGGFAWEEKIGTVEVRSDGKKLRSKTIKCKPDADEHERSSTMVVPFELGAPGHVDLVVLYNRGVLAHDRTQVRRRAQKAVPVPSAPAPAP
jgi:hypothetical protein